MAITMEDLGKAYRRCHLERTGMSLLEALDQYAINLALHRVAENTLKKEADTQEPPKPAKYWEK